jgi:hypothetical protein
MKAITRGAFVWLAAISLVLVWTVGVFAHDSWLRPWSMVLAYCAIYSVVAVFLLWCCTKGSWKWIPALVLLVLAVTLGIPMPSFHRSVSVHNQTAAPIAVRFTAGEGARHREAVLPPDAKWSFTYFAGDHKKQQSILANLEVEDLSSKATARRQLDLPVNVAGPEITISTDWWAAMK